MITICLSALFIVLLSTLFWTRWRKVSFLRSLGIRGPKPNVVFGNYWEIRKIGFSTFFDKYTKECGKLWGYYEGMQPVVVVSDLELIKQVLVKDFRNFHCRRDLFIRTRPAYNSMFSVTSYTQWKRLREASSPAFTAARMKEMSPMINNCIDGLMPICEEHSGSPEGLDIYKELLRLTLDVTACCAFGIEAGCLADPDALWMRQCNALVGSMTDIHYSVPVLVSFPSLLNLVKPLINRMSETNFVLLNWWFDQAKQVILSKLQTPSDRKDFINLMIKANPHIAGIHGTQGVDKSSIPNGDTQDQSNAAKNMTHLTIEEIQATTALFILAGFETTGSSLAYSCYELALNPDIQDKLIEEIDNNFPSSSCRPDYYGVQELPYMDMFFKEVLRLYPIGFTGLSRRCSEKVNLGGQYPLPAGTVVHIDMAAVHSDPELWGPEPIDQCVPERFSPERVAARNPAALMAFGGGPRTCIGKRQALLIAKTFLVRLLSRYRLKTCAKTAQPLPLTTNFLVKPQHGVFLALTPR